MPPVHVLAGQLRHQVQLQQEIAGEDVSGATKVWQNFGGLRWASVEAMRGTDAWRQGQFTSEKYTKITMRYTAGVLADMRILFKSRVFVVVDPLNVQERNIRLDILCVELDGK